MKKELLISLGVMVLLTLIVGFTAFNLTSQWSNLPELVSKIVAKELLLESVSSKLDSQTKRVDVYVLNPDPEIKNEIYSLHNAILEHLRSIEIVTRNNPVERQRIEALSSFYNSSIYNAMLSVLKLKDDNIAQEELKKSIAELYLLNNEFLSNVNKEKTFTAPLYEENIVNLKNYFRNVTITITLICVLLGIILMTISVSHISALYERIEHQAEKERLISELTTAVCSTLDLQVIFDTAAKEIARALDVDRAYIVEYTSKKGIGIFTEYIKPDSLQQVKLASNLQIVDDKNPFFIEAKKSLKPVFVNDNTLRLKSGDYVQKYIDIGMLSFVLVPIIIKEKDIYGFIQLETYIKKREWTQENAELLIELSYQLAVAITNAQLYSDARQKKEEANLLAQKLEVNLEEIKHINKELVRSNELNVKIQEAERLRISQDLHDEIIQGLISLIRSTDPSKHDLDIALVNKELNFITVQIRNICQNLRPSILDDLGLHSAIEWLLDNLEKEGIVGTIQIEGNEDTYISKKIELMIFRVIQELANNIQKHSKAKNAWVTINYEDHGISIDVEDDGLGFEFDQLNLNKTLGIIGIHERIKSLSGEIHFSSKPSQGTKIHIFIPVNSSKDNSIEE